MENTEQGSGELQQKASRQRQIPSYPDGSISQQEGAYFG
jgi:hypothetical protein